MKNSIHVFLILTIVLMSCSRNNGVEFENNAQLVSEYLEEVVFDVPSTMQEANNTMFVNAPAGLRVRNSPSINGSIIGVLGDLTEVFALRKEDNKVTIDGIDGKWTYIISNTIEGWVFGGFLSLEPLRMYGQQEYDDAEDFMWQISGNSIIITGFSGTHTNVRIPPQIQGMPVTEIAMDAFLGRNFIEGGMGSVQLY